MARFAPLNNYLYTVSNSDLKIFDIGYPEFPNYVGKITPGNWNIETIYPFKDKLFIGSSNGMLIYDATDPLKPTQAGQFTHARVCDPVIADDKYAYITLRSGTTCQGFTNELDILNVYNVLSPQLSSVFKMTNPHGLSKDGNLLFVCDGTEGLRILDASNSAQVTQLKQVTGIGETFDVIAQDNNAIV